MKNTEGKRSCYGLVGICALVLLLSIGCSLRDSSRPEYDYDGTRTLQELDRLEQMSKIEEALGHDTHGLSTLLKTRSSAMSVQKTQDLLVRCRDKYVEGLKGKSGVPLGGIGAGTVELWPDGGLHDWRIGENWDRVREPEFSYFALRCSAAGSGRSSTRVLQNSRWAGRLRTEHIEYDGEFPFVFLDYGSGKQPVAIRAEVFSSLIPNNAEDSCLPLARFGFTLENALDENVDVSLTFALGTSPLMGKGVSSFVQAEGLSSITYESGRDSVALSTTATDSSHGASWIGEFLPSEFRRSGRLNGAMGEDNGRIALCAHLDLGPHESKKVIFFLSWFFPDFRQRPTRSGSMELKFKELGTTQEAEAGKYYGRRYNRFGSAREVAIYFARNLERLESGTRRWHETIYKSSLDNWFKHFLSNSLYPLFKTSFWTEQGLFNILESTNAAPNLDCIHVRYYGSIPLALMFPELDKQVLRRMAQHRGPFGGEKPGQIPEQFYGFSMELPFGRALLQNNLVFVLMVYRDYLWTGDKNFLREMWPAVKEAMALAALADTDRDGLPDDTGINQTYDDYDMGDSSAYISGIWLASLRAAEEIAAAMEEPEAAKSFMESFLRGREAMETMLWRGEYYGFTEGERGTVCFADALNGQWYADMLGLGDVLDGERIHRTLSSIFTYNDAASRHGIVNGFVPGYGIDFPKQTGTFQTQSGSVWTGTTFAVASLALYRGFYDEPLNAVREVYDNYSTGLENLWNLREANDPESGLPMAYPYYYRAMSLWSVLLGLEGFRYDAGEARLTISQSEKVPHLKAPLMVPGGFGEMEISRELDKERLSLTVQGGSFRLKEIRLPRGPHRDEIRSSVLLKGMAVGSAAVSDGSETVVSFSSMQHIGPGETLRIELENSNSDE